MPTLTQLPLQGDLVKYVLEPNFNYESVVLLTGTNYLLGAVLGLITATGKFKLAEVGAVDGSAVAVAVLAFASNATAGDTIAVIIRRGLAIVSRAALVFHPSVTAGALTTTKLNELIAVGIVPRTTA